MHEQFQIICSGFYQDNLTYAEIVQGVWGMDDIGGTKKLQVNMVNIRKKMGEKPGANKYIKNELYIGYRMLVENNL